MLHGCALRDDDDDDNDDQQVGHANVTTFENSRSLQRGEGEEHR